MGMLLLKMCLQGVFEAMHGVLGFELQTTAINELSVLTWWDSIRAPCLWSADTWGTPAMVSIASLSSAVLGITPTYRKPEEGACLYQCLNFSTYSFISCNLILLKVNIYEMIYIISLYALAQAVTIEQVLAESEHAGRVHPAVHPQPYN